MRGIILAGGTGSRLHPLTKVTNKHLLPVANNLMVSYPLHTFLKAGIKDILIITGKENCGDFMRLLGSGAEYHCHFTYRIQDEAGGIAHALSLAEDFARGEPIAVILGDNYFEETMDFSTFLGGARIFLKEVKDAERFGVAEVSGDRVTRIEEKPAQPKSNFAVTGLYVYDSRVFDIVKTLTPSHRGELEITDVNNAYIQEGKMSFTLLQGFWSDMGTHKSLLRSAQFIAAKEEL